MTKLLRHFQTMQGAGKHFIEPGSYIAYTDHTVADAGDREARESLFMTDMIYLLDSPEQREAQFDFLSLSARTVSGDFHGQFVPMYALREAFEDFMTAGERLDVIKKLIFYGEDKAKGRVSLVRTADLGDYNAYVALGALTAAARTSDSEDLSGGSEAVKRAELILHAVLGVATEATEMVEAVYKAVFEGGELDMTNLLEESGDTKWYLAILARVMGVDWDEDERRIIAKLMKRYADKFNSVEANNRDLFAERQVLERPAETVTLDLKVSVAQIPEIAPVFDLVRDCGEKFRSYEAQHRAKGTPESLAKAEVNNEMAERCEQTLELFVERQVLERPAITNESVSIAEKKLTNSSAYGRMAFATGDPNGIPKELDDRRFFVIDPALPMSQGGADGHDTSILEPRKHVGTIAELVSEGTMTQEDAAKTAINTGDCACGQGGSWGHASGCPETDTPLEYPTA